MRPRQPHAPRRTADAMSIKVMTLVWQYSRNKGSALLLELAIADHAHDDGSGAWPSVKTLAQKVRMSERNVQLLLRKLNRSKELKTNQGAGPFGSNAYTIDIELLSWGEIISPLKSSRQGVKSHAPGVQSDAGVVKSSAANRVKSSSPKPNRHIRSLEQERNHQQQGNSNADAVCNPGLVEHFAQEINLNFGIDLPQARTIAKLPHIKEDYLARWKSFSERNEYVSLRSQRAKVLGAGFYVTRLKENAEPV